MAKKKPFPTHTAPRSLEDIKNEFSQLQFALGQQQYLVSRHSKRVIEIQEQMRQVDNEAGVRQDLDRKVAAEAAKEVKPNEPT